jgi:hypothetical protein
MKKPITAFLLRNHVIMKQEPTVVFLVGNREILKQGQPQRFF